MFPGFCTQCGKLLVPEYRFCAFYGHKVG